MLGELFAANDEQRPTNNRLLGLWPATCLLLALVLPQAVHADNECDPVPPTGTDPSDNGAAPDFYSCDGDFSPDGITYASDGDLTVTFDLSSHRLGQEGGVNLTGNDTDTVNLIVDGNLRRDSLSDAGEPIEFTTPLVDLQTGATATIDVTNASIASGTISNDRSVNDPTLRASGAGSLVINYDTSTFVPSHFNDTVYLKGRFDFSGLDGGVVFNNITAVTAGDSSGNYGWNTAGESVFSPGDDVINNMGMIQTSSGGYRNFTTNDPDHPDFVPPPVTVIDFGAGDDTFNNTGVLIAGTANASIVSTPALARRSTTTLQNLEAFNNTGLILLGRGGGPRSVSDDPDGSDLKADDLLAMPGAAFTGSGASRIELDANFSTGGQTTCVQPVTSDCLDINGGSTAGSTLITVRDILPGDRGEVADILIIDVAGGSSAAEHFTLDPNSDQYSPEFGGVIDKGLVLYPLAYDEANQQHKLAATPSDNAMQLPLLMEAAEATWRTATATWFDRQADLRDTLREPGTGGGVWIRGSTQRGEREAKQSLTAYDRTLNYDNSHDLNTSALNLGVDLVSASEGDRAWVFGGMIGYAHGSAEFDHSANDAQIDGMTAGLYGSYVVGDFFVDGVLNGAWTELDFEVPDLGLELGQNANVLTADIDSLGVRLESGWRLRAGALGVEPLASLGYVRTSFEDMRARSAAGRRAATNIEFEDGTSFRGGLGLRLTLDSRFDALRTTWSLTGRVTEEFDEESKARIQRLGPGAEVTSELDGTLTELAGGVSLRNPDGSVSAFLNVNLEASDSYDSQGLSAGFRYQW